MSQKCRCSKQAEEYLSTQDHYEAISGRTRAIIRLLDVIHTNKHLLDTLPTVKDVSVAFDQIDDNLSLMDSLVNDMALELEKKPVRLCVAAG